MNRTNQTLGITPFRNRQSWWEPLPTTVRWTWPNDTVLKTVNLLLKPLNSHEGRRLFRGCAIKALIYEQGDSFRTSVKKTFPSKLITETNFIIGGFLAGLHRSPLICLCFAGLVSNLWQCRRQFQPTDHPSIISWRRLWGVLYIEFLDFEILLSSFTG